MPMSSQAIKRRSPLLLAGLWICVLIAAAAVLRRLYAFANPNPAGPPQLVGLDQAFDGHRGLTLAHILPALAFALLAPIGLLRPDASWIKPTLLALGTVVGLTAYAMSTFAVGGHVEQAAVLLFNSLFLYWLWRAYLRDRRGVSEDARRSWIRSVAILLGIATTRPVMGIFFATSRLTGLQPEQFFGIAFWIGFSINTLAVEWWLLGEPRRA
jgi:hypothetical protein